MSIPIYVCKAERRDKHITPRLPAAPGNLATLVPGARGSAPPSVSAESLWERLRHESEITKPLPFSRVCKAHSSVPPPPSCPAFFPGAAGEARGVWRGARHTPGHIQGPGLRAPAPPARPAADLALQQPGLDSSAGTEGRNVISAASFRLVGFFQSSAPRVREPHTHARPARAGPAPRDPVTLHLSSACAFHPPLGTTTPLVHPTSARALSPAPSLRQWALTVERAFSGSCVETGSPRGRAWHLRVSSRPCLSVIS